MLEKNLFISVKKFYRNFCIIIIFQIVNFYFVPPSLRVTYVCLVTFGWTVFLSYMKHKVSDCGRVTVSLVIW